MLNVKKVNPIKYFSILKNMPIDYNVKKNNYICRQFYMIFL
jgi:hypothetical protein